MTIKTSGMKAEAKSIQAISAQAHGEAADNRLLRKELLARVIFPTLFAKRW